MFSCDQFVVKGLVIYYSIPIICNIKIWIDYLYLVEDIVIKFNKINKIFTF